MPRAMVVGMSQKYALPLFGDLAARAQMELAKPTIEQARQRLGGAADPDVVCSPAIGEIIDLETKEGRAAGVVIYADANVIRVMLDGVRVRHVRAGTSTPHAGEATEDLRKLAADARKHWQAHRPRHAPTLEETVASAPAPPPEPSSTPEMGRQLAAGRSLAPGLLSLRPSPMVARDEERAELLEIATSVGNARPPHHRMVALIGEAGVGKSRLAEWLCEQVHEREVTVDGQEQQGGALRIDIGDRDQRGCDRESDGLGAPAELAFVFLAAIVEIADQRGDAAAGDEPPTLGQRQPQYRDRQQHDAGERDRPAVPLATRARRIVRQPADDAAVQPVAERDRGSGRGSCCGLEDHGR